MPEITAGWFATKEGLFQEKVCGVEWLNNHINHRAETVTNIAIPSDSKEERGDVDLKLDESIDD